MSTIAVDAMGGDSAPEEVVKGAILAKKEGVDVILSGDENLIKSYLGNEKIPVNPKNKEIAIQFYVFQNSSF